MNDLITSFPQCPSSENLQGILSFQFVEVDNVQEFPDLDPELNGLISPISLLPGKTWLDGWAPWGQLKFNEKESGQPGGAPYNINLTGFLPGDGPEIARLVANLRRSRFVVIYTDMNGIAKVLGNAESPMQFTASFSTDGRRGWEYSFKCAQAHAALNYTF
jgi:hypothetical protein